MYALKRVLATLKPRGPNALTTKIDPKTGKIVGVDVVPLGRGAAAKAKNEGWTGKEGQLKAAQWQAAQAKEKSDYIQKSASRGAVSAPSASDRENQARQQQAVARQYTTNQNTSDGQTPQKPKRGIPDNTKKIQLSESLTIGDTVQKTKTVPVYQVEDSKGKVRTFKAKETAEKFIQRTTGPPVIPEGATVVTPNVLLYNNNKTPNVDYLLQAKTQTEKQGPKDVKGGSFGRSLSQFNLQLEEAGKSPYIQWNPLLAPPYAAVKEGAGAVGFAINAMGYLTDWMGNKKDGESDIHVPKTAIGEGRAKPGAAHDCRARTGNRGLQASRVLDDRGRRQQGGAAVPRTTRLVSGRQGRAVQLRERDVGARGREDDSRRGRRQAESRQRQEAPAPA